MFDIMSQVRSTFKEKKLGGEVAFNANFSTGLDVLDLFCGGRDPETGMLYPGLPYGKMITLIGASGSAKTALGVKIARSIAGNFMGKSMIIHDDFERATERRRIKSLTGWNDSQLDRIYQHIDDENLYVENIYNQVEAIAELKSKHRDDLMVEFEHPLYGSEVPSYSVLAPTVILIDSQAMMTSKKVLDTEGMEQNNMAGSQQAIQNNVMYTRINTLLRSYNIIPIVINHISTAVKTGMFPDKPKTQYLKPDENLKGGVTSLYLSDTLIRSTANAKLERDKEFGIKGFMAELQMVKSRSNEAGKKFEAVFCQATGFDNILTTYSFLKKSGAIGGAGRGFFLKNLPDLKFTQKDFKEKYLESEELQQACFEMLYSDDIVDAIVPEISLDSETIEVPDPEEAI